MSEWRVWTAIGAAAVFRFLSPGDPGPFWKKAASTAASIAVGVSLYPAMLDLTGLAPESTMAPAVAGAVVLVARNVADRVLETKTLADILHLFKGTPRE